MYVGTGILRLIIIAEFAGGSWPWTMSGSNPGGTSSWVSSAESPRYWLLKLLGFDVEGIDLSFVTACSLPGAWFAKVPSTHDQRGSVRDRRYRPVIGQGE